MFEYTIIRSRRKSLSIIIERDRSVIVRAPQDLPDTKIKEEIQKRKVLIESKINSGQKTTNSIPKEFTTGEQFLYLGDYYTLEIILSDQPTVELGNTLQVHTKSTEDVKKLILAWYFRQAETILIPRIQFFAEHIGVRRKRINVISTQYTWGSCTIAGTLNFNWRIIKAPSEVIDYIVVHELAHLRERNHSSEFWNIVAIQLPQYENAKQWLKTNGHELDEDF